jgi:hypothetical protein
LIDKYDMETFGITSAQLDAERAARIAEEEARDRVTQQIIREQAEATAREEAARAEAQRQYDARVAAERKAEADRARAAESAYARAQQEAQARQVASNPGGWSDSQRAEAAETGMVSVGGVSVSNAATIAAQNEALFGPGTGDGSYNGDTGNNSGGGGIDYGGYSPTSEDSSYGGFFAKGGFVRPRKKSKKK